MADMDGCAFCEGASRTTWMLTHLTPPATQHSCEEHIEVNLISLLAIRLDVNMDWLYQTIETSVNELVAKAKAEVAKADAPKPARKRRAEPPAEPAEAVLDA